MMSKSRDAAFLSFLSMLLLTGLAAADICPLGDLNGDCRVDLQDLKLFTQQWLDSGECDGNAACADFDGLNGVNFVDFSILANSWFTQGVPLVINEFMASNNSASGFHDPAGDYDDWIEIYNFGDIPIDLAGMYLTDNLANHTKWRFPSGEPSQTTVPAKGFVVIWADDEAGEGPLHTNFKLSADGEEIGLFDSDGTTAIDTIVFGPQQPETSYGRFPDGNDGWITFEPPYGIPTPGAQNDNSNFSDSGDSVVVFNEIMYHCDVNEDKLQWIELYNQMAIDVDISGWSVVGNNMRYQFPQGTIIHGGGFLVLAKSPADLQAQTGCAGANGPFAGSLSSKEYKLWLRDNSRRVMDFVHYQDNGDWPAAPDGSGVSLAKIDPNSASAPPENWAWSPQMNGTPGAHNGLMSAAKTLTINEIAGSTDTDFFVEIRNNSGSAIQLQNHIIANSNGMQYVLPVYSLAAGGYKYYTSADMGFGAADGDKLFLYSPGKASVLDAAEVKKKIQGRSDQHDGRWQRPSVKTPGSENTFSFNENVVINEIMYHHQPHWFATGATTDANEWVELYNRGTSAVNLTGWSLDDGISFSFPTGTIIPAGGYLVVSNDANALKLLYPSITILGDFSGVLSNKGERLALLDSNKNIGDEVHYYDGKPWPEYADGGGSSLELRNPQADNSSPQAWAASDESGKAVWHTYTYGGYPHWSVGPKLWQEFVMGLLDAGEIYIDDISVIESPGGTNIQFIQNGNFNSGSTTAWRFGGNHDKTHIDQEPGNPSNYVLHLIAKGQAESIYNHAETTYANGEKVDGNNLYQISFRAKWLAGSPKLNTRLYFNLLPNTTVIEPAYLNGTPGARNSRYEANIGPTYSGFGHSPIIPVAGQQVAVSVTAKDPDGFGSCKLYYAVDSGSWSNTTMVNQGSGLYTAAIPGQTAGKVVQFYVEGMDSLAVTSTYPADGANSRALYKVKDTEPATNGLHNVRIIMTPDDWSFLTQITNTYTDDLIGATVVYDEKTVFYDVGVCFKGSLTTRAGHSDYNVNFNADRLFRGVLDSFTTDRKNSYPGNQPTSEILVKQILNHSGGISTQYDDLCRLIPHASDTSSAQLQIGHFTNLYLDSQYKDGSDGMIFKQELVYYPTSTVDGNPQSLKNLSAGSAWYPNPPIGYLGDNGDYYRQTYLVKNNRDIDDFSRIMEFAQTFDPLGSGTLAQLEQMMDIDEWLRAYAWTGVVCTFDNYFGSDTAHNHFFYVRPKDNRVVFLPWDNDFSWQRVKDPLRPASDFNAKILNVNTEYRRRYYGHLYDIITRSVTPSYLTYWANHFGTLIPEENYANYLKFYLDRASWILTTQLPVQVPFAITDNDFTTGENYAQINGNAWINVGEIYIDGRPNPLKPSWTSSGSGTNERYYWHATVALERGKNRLTFLAYDFQNNLIASDTITVTCTAP